MYEKKSVAHFIDRLIVAQDLGVLKYTEIDATTIRIMLPYYTPKHKLNNFILAIQHQYPVEDVNIFQYSPSRYDSQHNIFTVCLDIYIDVHGD